MYDYERDVRQAQALIDRAVECLESAQASKQISSSEIHALEDALIQLKRAARICNL